jgi:hypothetical protein
VCGVLPGLSGRFGRMSGAKEHDGKNEGAVSVRKDIKDASPHHIGRDSRAPLSPLAGLLRQ